MPQKGIQKHWHTYHNVIMHVVPQVLQLADHFALTELKRLCERVILHQLTQRWDDIKWRAACADGGGDGGGSSSMPCSTSASYSLAGAGAVAGGVDGSSSSKDIWSARCAEQHWLLYEYAEQHNAASLAQAAAWQLLIASGLGGLKLAPGQHHTLTFPIPTACTQYYSWMVSTALSAWEEHATAMDDTAGPQLRTIVSRGTAGGTNRAADVYRIKGLPKAWLASVAPDQHHMWLQRIATALATAILGPARAHARSRDAAGSSHEAKVAVAAPAVQSPLGVLLNAFADWSPIGSSDDGEDHMLSPGDDWNAAPSDDDEGAWGHAHGQYGHHGMGGDSDSDSGDSDDGPGGFDGASFDDEDSMEDYEEGGSSGAEPDY